MRLLQDAAAVARSPLSPSAALGALVTALGLFLGPSAEALSGRPLNVGTPSSIDALQVAVDPSGTAYVVWANTQDLPPNATNVVQYCVIPAGALGCSHSGTLTPADGAQAIDGVQVLAVTVSCAKTPCTFTITITGDPPANGRPKLVTIAAGKVTLRRKGNHGVAVKLTGAGKRLLKAHHGRAKATALLSGRGLSTVTTTLTITIPRRK